MNVQWYPGHMAKAKKEIEEKIKFVDIVYVLLDARIPYSSSNPMINDILKDKKKLYLLTKSDMADSNVTSKWVKYYKDQGIEALTIDSISGFNVKKIEVLSKEILKEKIQRDLNRGMKQRPIRAMIVGIPNVGKSTLINKLVNKKATVVGNKPGVTKAQQWIRLNPNLELLDTPGVLWPKFDDMTVGAKLALTGAIRDEVLRKEDLIFFLLKYLDKNYKNLLFNKYNIETSYINDELDCVSYVTTFLKKYNIQNDDYDRIYTMILNDFKNGRLGKISLDLVE